jgi:hypothetical protein
MITNRSPECDKRPSRCSPQNRQLASHQLLKVRRDVEALSALNYPHGVYPRGVAEIVFVDAFRPSRATK